MTLLEAGLFLILGLIFGSFANVVIHRWPLKQSVVSPRSRCPSCLTPISWYDNVPVISWLLLKGKCRKCAASISPRYPLVELLTGVLFMALFIRWGWTWTLLEQLWFAFGLVVVSFIDLDHFLLPDVWTLPGIAMGLIGGILNPDRDFFSSLMGMLLGGGFLWAVAYVYFIFRKEEGMGGGDVKLLAWIGAVLGWAAIPFVILASSLVGSLVGVLVAGRSQAGLKASIPFGPYLAVAALLYIFWGEALMDWYWSLFIPRLYPVN